jgi:hypothetical protein
MLILLIIDDVNGCFFGIQREKTAEVTFFMQFGHYS